MENLKTRSLKEIEQKMENLPEDSLRYHILNSARNFKSSWIELGRALYGVWKDKVFKTWGYNTFDIYVLREIGIKKQTAMKLLRSYFFLEKEEPQYLRQDFVKVVDVPLVPSFESIDVLRLAKSKKTLDEEDYTNLKKDIFEKGKDVREIKKDLTALIRQREELTPEEAWEKKRSSTVKRLLATLKSLKQEIEISKLLPASFIKETAALISKLESQIQ